MKLLLVTGRFPVRSETFIYRKCVALANHGHDVTMLTRRDGEWALYPDALPPSLRVEVMPADSSLRAPRVLLGSLLSAARYAKRSPRGAKRLWADARKNSGTRAREFLRYLPFVEREADIVHFEFLSLGAMYPELRRYVACPIVVSCRGQDLHTLELRTPEERRPALDCLRQVDAIHCVSEEMAAEVLRLVGPRDGVFVNRPAVETSRIRQRPPTEAGGPLRILATGRLVWKKGFDYLLAALARVARAGVQFHLEILGDGELKDSLQFSISDLGLDAYVTLVGGVSSAAVLERLQSTDLFVLPSVEEGISNAVLEAMATGIPIVTTDAGGMAEAVTNGVEGFVVPVRDIPALASRIEQLIGDPQLRTAMGNAARSRALRDFSLERQVAVYEQAYGALR